MALRTFIAAAAAVLAVAVLPGAGSPSPRQFRSPYPCGYCLFAVPLAGGPMRILVGNPRVASIDDVDAARKVMLFTRSELGRGTGVFVAALDGGGERRVADGESGKWSPDGRRIAYRGGPPPRPNTGDCAGKPLSVVDANGSNAQRLGSCSGSPAWAPDSRRIAFFELYGLNADVGTLALAPVDGGPRLVGGGVQIPREPAWSPAGDRVAFTAFPDAEPASSHGVSSGEPRELATPVVEIVGLDGARLGVLPRSYAPVWSPTGAELAIQHLDAALWTGYEVADFRTSLRITSAAGTNARIVRRACCSLIRWVPGGDRLAIVDEGPSPRRGALAEQIYVIRRDGSGARQVTSFQPGGTIRGLWITREATSLYVLWEFTDVD